MYTQDTQVRLKLWHKDFWLMSLANMLVTMAMYLMFPILPEWVESRVWATPMKVSLLIGLPGIGIFLLGGVCSYLIQRYRRNNVCILSIVGMALCFYALYYVDGNGWSAPVVFTVAVVIRLLQGMAFGLAQMVLSSTLIIDTCESFHRTEANYFAAWFSRMALSLGPIVGLAVFMRFGFSSAMLAGLILCVLAALGVSMVKFPFKAPGEVVKMVSTDRFFLPRGIWLFVNLAIITFSVGILLSVGRSCSFYAMIGVGFLVALLAARFVFVNADLKSEVVTGLLLLGTASLLMLFGDVHVYKYASPVLIGCGIGLIGARFLLFFIKLSSHCQRGTSHSTYFLSWETGLYLGLFTGIALLNNDSKCASTLSLIFVCLALVMYVAFTHKWYMVHKNR